MQKEGGWNIPPFERCRTWEPAVGLTSERALVSVLCLKPAARHSHCVSPAITTNQTAYSTDPISLLFLRNATTRPTRPCSKRTPADGNEGHVKVNIGRLPWRIQLLVLAAVEVLTISSPHFRILPCYLPYQHRRAAPIFTERCLVVESRWHARRRQSPRV